MQHSSNRTKIAGEACKVFKDGLSVEQLERPMNIHEYQGKMLLRDAGVPVLEGVHCTTVDEALNAYDALGSKVVAVKSQIHAGGRGKGTMYLSLIHI